MTPGATLTAEPVPGVGDAAAAMVDAAWRHRLPGVLCRWRDRFLVANTGRTVTVEDVSDLANRAIARIDPSLLAPGASSQPIPSADRAATHAHGPATRRRPGNDDCLGLLSSSPLRRDIRPACRHGRPSRTPRPAPLVRARRRSVEVVVSAARRDPARRSRPSRARRGHGPDAWLHRLRPRGRHRPCPGLRGQPLGESRGWIADVHQGRRPVPGSGGQRPDPGRQHGVRGRGAGRRARPQRRPRPRRRPHPDADARPVVGPVQAPGPSDISLDPVVVATSVVAAAGIVLLIPFPSALFNSTLEQNYAEDPGLVPVRRRRRPHRRRRCTDRTGPDEPPDDDPPGAGGPAAVGRRRDRSRDSRRGAQAAAPAAARPARSTASGRLRVGAVAFFAVAGLLYGFLDPDFGFSLDSLLLYLGILGALAAGTLASNAALRGARDAPQRRAGSFRVLPATLLVALVCVLVTRITDFQPGYLYGVLAGLVFATAIGRRETGREHAITSSAVAGVGVLAFLVLGVVRALEGSGGPTGAWIPVDVLLSALVIGGFEGLLFGMLPLTGLPGAAVKAWDARVWALLLFLGTLGFLHIIVNPSSGYLVDTSRTPLLKALALLIGFGLVSVGLWAWFRYRPMDRWRERQAQRASAAAPPPSRRTRAAPATRHRTQHADATTGDAGDEAAADVGATVAGDDERSLTRLARADVDALRALPADR